ncbi:hypothetical protein VMCG_06202 [Cytospora schulzeri]|uniref:C2H2-type domain-containing protein n=1 Tax=Cytospora schulzeri TaxID=448051 RepID=A0A423W957_9PEZI|nr:hypothetical protein VMCG_06202 [Valsa malicola]
MSSSTYSIHPSLLDNGNGSSRDRTWPPNCELLDSAHPPPSASPFTSAHLSPYSQIPRDSVSPTLHNASTPADSLSAFSEHYPISDLSELENSDPFFGVDFNSEGGTPSFLEDQNSSDQSQPSFTEVLPSRSQDEYGRHPYPLSPDPTTPSIHTTSPRSDRKSPRAAGDTPPESIFYQPLSQAPGNAFSGFSLGQVAAQPTPQEQSSSRSSEDSLASNAAPMPSPSPRVTVSLWGKDQDAYPDHAESPTTVRAGVSTNDNFNSAPSQASSVPRDEHGIWGPDSRTGYRTGYQGWSPETRPAGEAVSINDLDARRKLAERNQQVGQWIATSEGGVAPDTPPIQPDPRAAEDDGINSREISLGHQTENKHLPGQTYYTETGGDLTQDDIDMMRQHRLWSDAPSMFPIYQEDSGRQQPESSKAAIERFEQMCQDTSSILSRAATWGTRRRSLPSDADIEGITSGSFLKRLSINRERKPSILLKELRGLVRKPSTSGVLKRNRSVQEAEVPVVAEDLDRRESQNSLAPPNRTGSWGKKPQMPSLNTALVSMATGAAAIGTSHARTSSISNATSPKSPFNLQVRNTLRRPRSKSDLPKGAKDESHPNLVGMWKKNGGPPVAQLAKGAPAAEQDDEEDEDEDFYEEGEARTGASNVIDDITPNLAGFKQYVLRMNPRLAEQNTFLVDRIAHQQIVRYKSLLNNRVKHLQHTSTRNCPCGAMCITLGGSAILLDTRGDGRGMDPLSTSYAGSDGDVTPLEGAVSAESFPSDIPMPPTNTLPAEFECQLCYQAKKFTKPSDWTKHVHEDVQPFTCTWDKCREPKLFKRKADWVRHENEGHRHLEWWRCDVDDCWHTCYRRDNFLQHLVREHKFPEPKVKTKAAIKRAGGLDPTWQKVEQCHAETKAKPQDEPCRFCGKTLPTWKKLTVHLAKHMESMSLPVLRLVARTEIEPDSIISPVQDPPPRTFPPAPAVKTERQPINSQSAGHSPMHHQPGVFAIPNNQQSPFAFQAQGTFSDPFYDPSLHGIPQPGTLNLGLHQPGMGAGFQAQGGYSSLPVTTSPFATPAGQFMTISQQSEPFPAYMNPLGLQDTSGNQIYDTSLDPVSTGGEQYTPQGSISPYARSPLPGQGGFYSHQ